MVRKRVHALQPYRVGGKASVSLAVIIPSEVVKECNISEDTIFGLKVDTTKKTLTIETIKGLPFLSLGEEECEEI